MPRPVSEAKKLEWNRLIEEQRQSGLSIEKWCRHQNLTPHTFHYWKDKLFPKQLQKTSFTEFNMRRHEAISLQARGLYVRMGNDCDPILRKQFFALFAEATC
jgi:hypothetical protein